MGGVISLIGKSAADMAGWTDDGGQPAPAAPAGAVVGGGWQWEWVTGRTGREPPPPPLRESGGGVGNVTKKQQAETRENAQVTCSVSLSGCGVQLWHACKCTNSTTSGASNSTSCRKIYFHGLWRA